MYEYAFDTEVVRLAILLGVVVSMLFYDTYGVTTGGTIVPGYLALFVFSPSQIVMILLIATLTYYIVQKIFRPRLMLWGRRLFEAEVLVALVLMSLWWGVLFLFTPYVPQLNLLQVFGFVLPGIIAHDMGRQGVRTTIWAAVICALIVFGLVVLIGAVRDIFDLPISLVDRVFHAQTEAYAYPQEWLFGAIFTSVLISMVLYRHGLFTNSLGTGGFVTAGYLALFVTRPADLLFILICSGLTYVIVTQGLMKQAILFGRTKMATMFMTGMIITWLAEIVIFGGDFDFIPWRGFNAIAPTVVALLANDAQRQGPHRTLLGTGMSTLAIFIIMNLLYFGYNLLFSEDSVLALVG
jgi:poly-gamma-glutamate biosynthesis protein PgsC/CapC